MNLHVQTSGHGPALVLLHGWGMRATVWRGLAAELARDFQLHAVDWHAADDVSLAALVDALAAGLPRRLSVCGWSLGGQLALAWARAQPQQVERLVLIATTPRFVCGEDWHAGMSAQLFERFAHTVVGDGERALRRFLALQADGDVAAREVLRELHATLDADGALQGGALNAGLRLLRDTDLRADLARIRQPALVVHGDSDSVISCAAGKFLAGTLPHAEFAAIEGAAHAPFITRERAIAQRIRDFHGRR